jgi:hypothetical protein
VFASGHGPVFGAATPTLGRGGWSVDQAWTCRVGEDEQRQQMLKTMLSFGITENLQLSGSFPLVMGDARLPPARMMSAMSGDREFEGLVGIGFNGAPSVLVAVRNRRCIWAARRRWKVAGMMSASEARSRPGSRRVTHLARITSGWAERSSISRNATAIDSGIPGWSPLCTGTGRPPCEPKPASRICGSSSNDGRRSRERARLGC